MPQGACEAPSAASLSLSHELLRRAAVDLYGKPTCECFSPFAKKADYRVGVSPSGKPYFPGRPDVHFSISHSGGYWVCAFAPAEIGLDFQTTNRRGGKMELLHLARRFFTPQEQEYFVRGSDSDFYAIWAMKEAYAKYAGCGLPKILGRVSAVSDGKLCERMGGTPSGSGNPPDALGTPRDSGNPPDERSTSRDGGSYAVREEGFPVGYLQRLDTPPGYAAWICAAALPPFTIRKKELR